MYSLSLVILAWLGLSYKVINHRRDKQRAALRDGDASERPEDLDNAFDDMTGESGRGGYEVFTCLPLSFDEM